MLRLSSIFVAILLSVNAIAQSPHGSGLKIRCDECHTQEGWKFNPASSTFDHSRTVFPLTGQHNTVSCRSCHKDLNFARAKTSCNSCHIDVHQQTVGLDCQRCHTTSKWIVSNITEIHRTSRFPLQGQHAQLDCYLCHTSASLLRFDPIGVECNDCHAKNFIATTKPSHSQAKFPADCFLCHTDKNWQPAKFDHNTSTAFPLKNAHFGVECVKCHTNGYTAVSKECLSCHQKDYNTALIPPHLAAKLPTECLKCHTDITWKPSTFNHNTGTQFPLKGGHINVDCIKCHSNGYVNTPTACVSCHQSNFTASTNPSHVAAKFTTDCIKCHTEKAWKPSSYNHNTSTNFPLRGGHIGVDCIKCHTAGYAGIPATCISCHQKDYNIALIPPHLAAKLPTECLKCHTETAWKPSTFNHNTGTTFPLTGGHSGVDCIKCHSNGYTAVSKECLSCHQKDYNAALNPPHLAAKLPTECLKCHTNITWKPSTFNHNTGTQFPLKGRHINVDCIKCHTNGYVNTPTACVSCHQANFTASTNPSHVAAKFQTDCIKCHTENAWKPSSYNHNTSTNFPLRGGHIGVDCIKCHTTGYAGILATCISCHQKDYNIVANPPHLSAKLPTECLKCHTESAWKPSIFNHNTGTAFPLTGGHSGVDCIKCHSKGYVGTSKECSSCHNPEFLATTNPSHINAKFPTDCTICHTQTAWKPSSFFHSTNTSFPLTQGHAAVECIRCHSTGYTGTSRDCFSCHLAKYNTATNPSHVSAKFPTDCTQCHNMTAWKPSTFNHTTKTTFALTGGHVGVDCIKCHTNGYVGTTKICSGCHTNNFNATTNPSHTAAKFPTDCTLCHTSVAWKPSTFNHNTKTTFALTGGHLGVDCIRCHANGYVGTTKICSGCHLNNYNATTNPGHSAAKFPTECTICHTSVAWKPSTFNHNTNTTFPLTGGHAGVDCFKCHATGYKGTTKICYGCHLNTYNATTNPGHSAAKFPTDCTICHTSVAWKPSTFNHNTKTTFALTGGHVGVDCIKCHANGYLGTTKICSGCHTNNYNATTNPSHTAAKFPTDCTICHTSVAWKPSAFNHNTKTTFPLTGGHIGVDCLKCHATGYVGTTKLCSGCHLNNYNATTNPAHIAAKFPTDCTICHTSVAWKPSAFNHNTKTTFPLTGGHIGVDCLKCHATGYVGTTKICSGCHLNHYNATTNPSHIAAKFPTDCTICHSSVAWKPSTFNHNTNTTFPLTGGHVGVDCLKCHSTGYKGTTKICSGCHLNTFNATTNPGHIAAKFPTDCSICHTSVAWKPSTFNHNTNTTFPLTGGHTGVECLKCHATGYVGTTKLCSGCHINNYNASTNPGHLAAKFPTDCTKCHTVTAWRPSNFNHSTGTTFPLTGGHTGVECLKCHATGYVGTTKLCSGCHINNYNASTNPGHLAAKFSTDCTKCHTVNAWRPSTFNHSTGTTFPLTGGHVGVDCLKCHATGYVGTTKLCSGCHLTKYNATTNPGHAAAKFPTNCESCHTMTAWVPSTFNHDTQYFRIYSGKHRGAWTLCTQCHTNASNYKVFSCIDCHEHTKSSMDSEHKGKTGYIYNSTNCLSCHPRV